MLDIVISFWQLVGPWILTALFITGPVFLGLIAWQVWIRYIQLQHIRSIDWVLLDIKMPKNLTRSPQAMEVVLGIFHQTRDGTFIKRWWEGLIRTWFSLEIASFGGEIHFYMYVPKFFKNLVESHIYSEYPTVEIYEVEDYTHQVPYGQPGSDWDLWACHFKLDKEDPYPIKTYVDYKMEAKEGIKQEEQIDPIAPILELLGSLNPGEQIWFQIIIRAAKKRFRKKGSWFKKVDWKDKGEELLKTLLKRDVKKKTDEVFPAEFTLSSGEKQIVEAVERNISKLGFDCGLRAIYLAKHDKFNMANVVGLISMIKQFNSLNLNGFKPANTTSFDYPWQDINNWRLNRAKWRMFDAYRQRSYFYPPYQFEPMTLNTEEIATIYHFPGDVVETPSLSRIPSKRGEPPVNLPV